MCKCTQEANLPTPWVPLQFAPMNKEKPTLPKPLTRPASHRLVGLRLLCLLILACFAAIYFSRTWLLCSAAHFLVQEGTNPPRLYIVLWEPDEMASEAAQLTHAFPAMRLVLIEERPRLSERLGGRPDTVERARKYLRHHSVPEQAILVVPGQGRTVWDRAACLRDWLDANPAAEITVLCSRFHGRQLRRTLTKVLGKHEAERLHIVSVRDPLYDETNWWQSKPGALAFFDSYVRLIFNWTCGPDTDRWSEWDPDEYEKTLTAQR